MARHLLAVLAGASVLASCGAGDAASIRVLAASSLTDAFDALAQEFEQTGAGTDTGVELVFAGSSALATQLEEGAPADVVATADGSTMERIVLSGRAVAAPVEFARNSLVIAVTPAAALQVRSLADLARDDLLVALCAPQVPCGRLSEQLLERSGLQVDPVSREPNVRAVLTKVVLGEVDAGLVYATDLVGVPPSEAVAVVPEGATTLTTTYPIAQLSEAPAAQAFVDFVRSPDGRRILERFGFETSDP